MSNSRVKITFIYLFAIIIAGFSFVGTKKFYICVLAPTVHLKESKALARHILLEDSVGGSSSIPLVLLYENKNFINALATEEKVQFFSVLATEIIADGEMYLVFYELFDDYACEMSKILNTKNDNPPSRNYKKGYTVSFKNILSEECKRIN